MDLQLKNEISSDFSKIITRFEQRPDFIIQLTPITKKNSQRILKNFKTGKFFIAPSEQYEEYAESAGYFMRPADIDYAVNIAYWFYMPTRRRCDLPNLTNAADDILVKYNVIKDDNYAIIKAHDGSRVLYDKENPRTEIYITRLDLTRF